MKTENNLKPGQIVKYSNPLEGEESIQFIILENRENRLFVQLVCDSYLKPTFCYSISDFTTI